MVEQTKAEYVLDNLLAQKESLEKQLQTADETTAKAIEKELKSVEKQIEKRS